MKTKSPYAATLHACYMGYITQAIVVNLAPLFFVIFQREFAITYKQLANLVFITFVIQIVVDAIMVKGILAMGYRRCAIVSHIFAVLGLIGLSVFPYIMKPYWGLLLALLLYSIGGGLIEVVISPIVDALPGDAKASAMSLLHAFYSWGQMIVVILTTVVLSLLGNQNWRYIPLLWALLPLYNILAFAKAPMPAMIQMHEEKGILRFFRSPVVYIALLLMICGGASEQAMAQWASLFAEKALEVPKIVGDLLGPCLFALCMGIGRTAYGILGAKMHISKALFGCACLTIACYAITVFSPIPVLSLIGCALCGLGVSLLWPGVLSYSSQKFQYQAGPALLTILALGGDIGCSLGPWLTGMVSDRYLANQSVITANTESWAIRYGLLAAAVFPAVLLVAVLIMQRLKTPQKDNN